MHTDIGEASADSLPLGNLIFLKLAQDPSKYRFSCHIFLRASNIQGAIISLEFYDRDSLFFK